MKYFFFLSFFYLFYSKSYTQEVYLKETSPKIEGSFLFTFIEVKGDSIYLKKYRLFFNKKKKNIESLRSNDLIIKIFYCEKVDRFENGIILKCLNNSKEDIYYNSHYFSINHIYNDSVYNLIDNRFLLMSNEEKQLKIDELFRSKKKNIERKK